MQREKSQPCEVRDCRTKTEIVREKKREKKRRFGGKKLGYFCGVFYIEEHKIVG